MIDGKLQLKHALAAKKSDLNNIKNVGIADKQNTGKQSRDDCIKLFSIQSYPTYLSTLAGVVYCTVLCYLPALFAVLLSLQLITFLVFLPGSKVALHFLHLSVLLGERSEPPLVCTQEKCNVGAMGTSGKGGVEHETLSTCVILLTRPLVVRDHKAFLQS